MGMAVPDIDRASAEELARHIYAHHVGERVEVGASWMLREPLVRGEIAVPMDLTPELILYRNRMQPWPGFFVSGLVQGGVVTVHARDVGFDASRVFFFFNVLMDALGAHRFLPEVRTYPGHVLYRVRYIS